MYASFKIISLTKYEGVGNAQNLPINEYLSKKTERELQIYGVAGGSYYLPTFEVTFENGSKGVYRNFFEGSIIDIIDSLEGVNYLVADRDTLGYECYPPKLIHFDSEQSSTFRLNEKHLNPDFERILNKSGASSSELGYAAGQAAYAAGVRDAEVYVYK